MNELFCQGQIICFYVLLLSKQSVVFLCWKDFVIDLQPSQMLWLCLAQVQHPDPRHCCQCGGRRRHLSQDAQMVRSSCARKSGNSVHPVQLEGTNMIVMTVLLTNTLSHWSVIGSTNSSYSAWSWWWWCCWAVSTQHPHTGDTIWGAYCSHRVLYMLLNVFMTNNGLTWSVDILQRGTFTRREENPSDQQQHHHHHRSLASLHPPRSSANSPPHYTVVKNE